MSIKQRVELLHRSSERLMNSLDVPRDKYWWKFLQQESWIHLKRSWELWWMALMKKEV